MELETLRRPPSFRYGTRFCRGFWAIYLAASVVMLGYGFYALDVALGQVSTGCGNVTDQVPNNTLPVRLQSCSAATTKACWCKLMSCSNGCLIVSYSPLLTPNETQITNKTDGPVSNQTQGTTCAAEGCVIGCSLPDAADSDDSSDSSVSWPQTRMGKIGIALVTLGGTALVIALSVYLYQVMTMGFCYSLHPRL